jgi:hypothetical protein
MVNMEAINMDLLHTVKIEIKKAYGASAALTVVAGLMMIMFGASVAGMLLDERVIAGFPAWLKPAKFAISAAIYCGTLAWLFQYLTSWPRLARGMGTVTAAVLVIEVAIIDLQAARGTTSHFNVATLMDGILFSVMGFSIAILWLASVALLVALFRQSFADPSWGWWLRLGMLTTVLGSAAGGMMVRLTSEQAAILQAGQRITTAGSHTVGAPDGGPGLPGLGWSTVNGDLRSAHFAGLHGIQILPLVGWLLFRRARITSAMRTRLAFAVSGSYLALFLLLAWQALRGQSIVAPDSTSLMAFLVWLGSTGVAVFLAGHRSAPDLAVTNGIAT